MRLIKSYMYTPQEIQLAHELANTLGDQPSLSFYLAATKKHNHRYLRTVLNHVMSMPDYMIRKSRGALFTHIISDKTKTFTDDETAEFDDSWN